MGTYGDKVEKVAVSTRIETTPCVFVTSQYGYSANMERIMNSQAFSDNKRTQYLVSKKTLEINPRHPIVVELLKRAVESPDDQETKDLAWVMHDTALLNSGFNMDAPKDFAGRMYRLIKGGLNLDSLDLVDEIEVPEEEEEEEDEEEEEEEDADAEEAGDDGEEKSD